MTITATHPPPTDLGYLLAKNPDKLQTFSLAYGQAHVFYPVTTQECCTTALLLDIDPIGLVRGRGARRKWETSGNPSKIAPYAASSFTSVAIAQVFGSALNGKSRERPEVKLLRKLRGQDVKLTQGLTQSVEQLDASSEAFRAAVARFIDDLVSHHVLEDGILMVAHAGS